jgi:hypothetical protein
MSQNRAGLLHRIAVDWVADTFHLRTPDARTRHEHARDRAAARAAPQPARLHTERGEPRVLKGWQARIGGLARQARTRDEGQE